MTKFHKSARGRQRKTALTSVATGPTRRRFMIGGAAAVAGPLLLTPGKAKASEQLAIALWGGRFTENFEIAYLKPFTEETGIPVLAVGSPDMAKVRAMVKTNNVDWDLILPVSSWVTAGEHEGTWEDIDYSIVDMTDAADGTKRDQALGFEIVSGGIAWSKERDGEPGQHPETFAQFFDPEAIEGRRGLRTRPGETFEMALLGDGVKPEDLYPLDIERAFKALDRIKDSVSNWIAATPKTIELISQNECDFTYTYNGRVYGAQQAGLPIDYSFKQNINFVDWMAVIKGTKNKDAAMRLLAFIMRPDRQAAMTNLMAYPGTNTKSYELVKPEVQSWLPDLSNPNSAMLDIDWWGENQEVVEKRFKEWQLT